MIPNANRSGRKTARVFAHSIVKAVAHSAVARLLLTECRKEEPCKAASVSISLARQWQSRCVRKDMWLS
jgi:hypothetical protein